MFRATRCSGVLALLVLVAVSSVCPLRAQDDTANSRSFDFGQPLALARSGSAQYERVTARRTANQFEISTQPLYAVALYVDSAALRQAWRRYSGRPPEDLLADEGLHRAVREAAFPLAVVITMAHAFTADRIAQEFAQDLRDARGSEAFLGYLERDLAAGQEIVLRIHDGQVVTVTVYGRDCPDIWNRKFARALLGIWVGNGKLSSQRAGLFSRSLTWLR